MDILLNIETSDKNCSVALSDKGKVLAQKAAHGEKAHATMLTILIQNILSENNIHPNDLSAIAVSKGPGSYTGLRIGVSTAKGLCYALKKPLIAINTLYLMAYGIARNAKYSLPENALLCPMIDARRMEVYNAIFNSVPEELEPTNAAIINNQSFLTLLEKQKIVFFGSGASKCKAEISHPNALFIDDYLCSAADMAIPSSIYYEQKQFEDNAYFEPFYLKDFVATTSSKDVLRG